jgi:hypothetical protein
MTASFLDAQVSQLPTSYRKKAVTGAKGTKQQCSPFCPNAKRYSIVKEQRPQLQPNPPRSGLVQRFIDEVPICLESVLLILVSYQFWPVLSMKLYKIRGSYYIGI